MKTDLVFGFLFAAFFTMNALFSTLFAIAEWDLMQSITGFEAFVLRFAMAVVSIFGWLVAASAWWVAWKDRPHHR